MNGEIIKTPFLEGTESCHGLLWYRICTSVEHLNDLFKRRSLYLLKIGIYSSFLLPKLSFKSNLELQNLKITNLLLRIKPIEQILTEVLSLLKIGVKASGCVQGWTMDHSVKDQLPTEENPDPQFSIVNDNLKLAIKSMNNGEIAEPEARPNLWSKPMSNWARLHFTGFKIHHTTEKTWMRNADIHMDNWQFSDNARAYVIKASAPVIGIVCDSLSEICINRRKKNFFEILKGEIKL